MEVRGRGEVKSNMRVLFLSCYLIGNQESLPILNGARIQRLIMVFKFIMITKRYMGNNIINRVHEGEKKWRDSFNELDLLSFIAWGLTDLG